MLHYAGSKKQDASGLMPPAFFMLKCIIVAGESQTVQTLKNYIRKIPFLEFTGSFVNPKDAYIFLKNNSTDLVFLETKKSITAGSPSYTIFQQQAGVIVIASNRKFAFDAIEQGAVDFLIKPVAFDRFYKASEKAYKIKFPSSSAEHAPSTLLKGGFIFVKEGTRLVRIELDDIYYVMGLKNYVSLYTKSQRVVSLLSMKEIEDLLPQQRFVRVHRSYFIALDKIISVEKQQIHLKDKIIPIGNIYLPLFMKRLVKKPNQ